MDNNVKKKVVLEYYSDKFLTNRIPVNEIGQPIFDWGEIMAGSNIKKTVFVKNMTNDNIALRQPYSHDEDFKILDYPLQLKGQESSVMKFEYTPAWNRTEPLDVAWGFEMIRG